MHAIALALALALPAAHAAEPGKHEHHHHAAQATAPAPATRWPADAPLRQGMNALRAALDTAQAQPSLSPAAARATALAVQAQVSFLVENCRLEPEADAALHGILSELLAGSAALEREPARGLARMAQALKTYPQRFEHPGW